MDHQVRLKHMFGIVIGVLAMLTANSEGYRVISKAKHVIHVLPNFILVRGGPARLLLMVGRKRSLVR